LNLFLSPSRGGGENRLLFAGQPLYWDWLGDDNRLIVHSGPPGRDGRLAFVDAQEGGSAADADIADPGFFQAPGVSAGGQYVAFSEFEGTERRLAVRNLDSDDTFRTTHDGAVALGWSPVDERLAYISPQRSARRDAGSYYGPLRLLDARSQQMRMLTQERVLAFFWAPDGQSIAYFTLAEGMGEQIAEGHPRQTGARTSAKVQRQHEEVRLTLSVIDADGGDPQHIVDFKPTELFLTQFLPFFDQYALSHHLWSPDSSALVLPIVEDDAARLYIVPASGRDVRLLVDGQIGFWSP
jgi:TolB protein